MSGQGNFVGGLLLGTLVGGAIGGVVGALAASRLSSADRHSTDLALDDLDNATEESMEAARLGLEAKIAQLNDAIDDVRQQLGHINGHTEKTWGSPSQVD